MPAKRKPANKKQESTQQIQQQSSEKRQSVTALAAHAEKDMNTEIMTVVRQILEGGSEASAITKVQIKSLTMLFTKQPKIF